LTRPITASGNVVTAHVKIDAERSRATPGPCTSVGRSYTAQLTISDGRIVTFVAKPS
jgi:hypothetical protein